MLWQHWARDRLSSTLRGLLNMDTTQRRALITVDVQNDFISGSGSKIVPLKNKFVESPFWDIVAYAKEWHAPDHISFVTNAKNFKPHTDNKIDLTQAKVRETCVFDVDGVAVGQTLWLPHCIQHSEGAELHKDLKVVEGGITIHKGMDTFMSSYSAFFDNARRSETALRQILQDNGISQVYICGVATEVCVSFTAFDCHGLGFETFLIEDCCYGEDIDKGEETIQKMRTTGIRILTTDDVLNAINETVE